MKDFKLIKVKEGILSENDDKASKLRQKLKNEKRFMINLMASPGAGKTTTLLKLAEILDKKIRLSVIEADIESTLDAEAVARENISTVQLQTGGFCHLDAEMVSGGLQEVLKTDPGLIIIENVGNLVCPAEFDTGAHSNIMILSVPEGDDKPVKYPLIFSVCDLLIVNKIDMISLTDFDMEKLEQRAKKVNPKIEIIPVSAKTGEGFENLKAWIESKIEKYRS
jgi:hydrogenase nickel incorporation protein HypB